MKVFSEKMRLRRTIRLCLGSLVLVSATSYASTSISNSDIGGVRLVGRLTDGSILLDGSNSKLAGLESPSVINRTNTQYPSAAELVVIGTIESLDRSSDTITVAGQTATVTESTRVIDALNGTSHSPVSFANSKQSLSAGDHVAIAGDVTGPGQSIARFVVRMATAAAPGTSLVYVRGVVEGVDPIGKEIAIGHLNLYVADGLDAYNNPDIGDIVEAVGYSAGVGQLAVVDIAGITYPEAGTVNKSSLKGIHGSGLRGIHGSGLKGIHGSGLKGIHGSGLKGIHGSGLKGIHGSGLKGIHGSGLKGIHGSGLKGIHGSGLKSADTSESSI
jgi:hypothetical protein